MGVYYVEQGSVAASELQGPWLDPVLRLLSVWSLCLWVLFQGSTQLWGGKNMPVGELVSLCCPYGNVALQGFMCMYNIVKFSSKA